MAIATRGTSSNYLQRAPSPTGLYDVVDLILDKGLILDAYIRVSVIGIELLTIDARIVIASIDSYLRFAEAVNRLDLTQTELAGLPELQEKGSEEMTKGATRHLSEDVVLEPLARDEEVANASFLVRRSRLSSFDTALDSHAARERQRMRFTSIGPLAPHTFMPALEEA